MRLKLYRKKEGRKHQKQQTQIKEHWYLSPRAKV